MTETKRYNGWTNYETWNVALWLDNDQGSYNHWRAVAQECWDDAEPGTYLTREENAKRDLAERLKDKHEEAAPELGASVWSDLLSAALSEVDWDEIASHYIDDVDKGEEEPAEPEDDEDDA